MTARTGLFVAPLPGSTPQGTSPTDGRLVLGGLFGTTAGLINGGVLTASATAMQITVAAAVWRIPDPTNASTVFLSPADPYVFTLSAGPASGSRIDVLWVKQDNFENSDADSRVIYGVAAGVAASTPTVPTVPAGAMKIAQVTVPTGASNAGACTTVQIFGGQSVVAPFVSAPGVSQLPAVGQYIGQRAYVATEEYRWNGSGWDLMPSPRTMAHVAYLNTATDPTLAAGNWTDVPNDTALYDPFGMRQSDNYTIKLPWTGRYSFWTRIATTGDEINSRTILCWNNLTVGNDMAWKSTMPVRATTPTDIYTEEILTAGNIVKPRFYRDSTGSNWLQHYLGAQNGNMSRLQSIVRYLGPA